VIEERFAEEAKRRLVEEGKQSGGLSRGGRGRAVENLPQPSIDKPAPKSRDKAAKVVSVSGRLAPGNKRLSRVSGRAP
jgi:hypothetical protein